MPSLAPRIDTIETTPSFSGAASFAAGSAAAPSLRFTVDTTTGLYRIGAGNIGFSCAGVAAGGINAGNWFAGLSGASGNKFSVNASSGAMPSICNSRTMSVYNDANLFGIQAVNGFATYTGVMISAYSLRASSNLFNFISCVNGDGSGYNVTNAFIVAGDGSITTAGGSSSTHNLNGLTQFNRNSGTAFASSTFPPNPAAWFINATNSGTTSLVMQVRDVSAVAHYASLTTYSPGNAQASLAFQLTQTGTTKLVFQMESDPSAGGIGRARVGDSVYIGDNYRLMLTGQNVSHIKAAILQFGDNAEGTSRQWAICNGRTAQGTQVGGQLLFVVANTGNADAYDANGITAFYMTSNTDTICGNLNYSASHYHDSARATAATGNAIVQIRSSGVASGQYFLECYYSTSTSSGGLQRNAATQTIQFFAGSDRRIKKDFSIYENQLDKLSAINLVRYGYKNDPDAFGYGPIAQDLYEIYPDKVTKKDDGLGETVLPENVWTIGSDWNWEIIRSIQELHVKIKELEARL